MRERRGHAIGVRFVVQESLGRSDLMRGAWRQEGKRGLRRGKGIKAKKKKTVNQ
jgi:hypothetical protein